MTIRFALTRSFPLVVVAAICACGGGADVAAGAHAASGSDGSAAAPVPGNAPRFACVTHADGVWGCSINDATGALSEIAGSPFAAGKPAGTIATTGGLR